MTTPYEAAAAMAQQARKLEILSKLAAEMALERAVLTLTESGTDSREVAAATGVKRRKVESIKAAYGDHQVQ
jgi:mannose/fructose-specific phosphotransferase system component IIA